MAVLQADQRRAHPVFGPPVVLRHNTCGHVADPLLVCAHCREELKPRDVTPEVAVSSQRAA